MNALVNCRLLFIVILLSMVIAGCSTTLKFGSVPATEKISSSLIQYSSTKDDVLKVLGQPRGYGKFQMSIMPEADVTWFYEYVEASSADMSINAKMLMVFFHKEFYAGHMWFSSFEKFEEK